MSRLTHCDVLRVSTNVLLRDWIINTNWPLRESRDIRVVIVSHKVLLLSGGWCEDMRDFIWLPRSYLINSWIQQNLSRVATTTSARGIEHGPDWDIPPDIRLRKGVSGPGTNQRPVWPALTNQRPVSRGECLHCRGSAEPAPTHPCLSLSCTPVNTCQKQPELKQNLPHWIGLPRQLLQNMMKRKMFNLSLLIKSTLSTGIIQALVVNPS